MYLSRFRSLQIPDDFSWPTDPTHPKRVRLGSGQEIRQDKEEIQRYFVPESVIKAVLEQHCSAG